MIRRFWRWAQARFRLSEAAVCELSKGMGLVDYHDYPDDEYGLPQHMVAMKCVRCGKEFTI